MIVTLVLQAAAQVDTVVTVPARDGYDFVQALAAGSVAATFMGFVLLMLFSIVQVRRAAHALDQARRQISLDPAVESLRRTVRHVESISESFDAEAAKLADSVSSLSDRLTQVSERMEERIEEFNALMEVVQAEAEGAFVDSASAARGVRAGFENLGSRRRSGSEDGSDGSTRRPGRARGSHARHGDPPGPPTELISDGTDDER